MRDTHSVEAETETQGWFTTSLKGSKRKIKLCGVFSLSSPGLTDACMEFVYPEVSMVYTDGLNVTGNSSRSTAMSYNNNSLTPET